MKSLPASSLRDDSGKGTMRRQRMTDRTWLEEGERRRGEKRIKEERRGDKGRGEEEQAMKRSKQNGC